MKKLSFFAAILLLSIALFSCKKTTIINESEEDRTGFASPKELFNFWGNDFSRNVNLEFWEGNRVTVKATLDTTNSGIPAMFDVFIYRLRMEGTVIQITNTPKNGLFIYLQDSRIVGAFNRTYNGQSIKKITW